MACKCKYCGGAKLEWWGTAIYYCQDCEITIDITKDKEDESN